MPRRDRCLAQLHPSLAAQYARLVAGIAGEIEEALAPAVVANRVAAASRDPVELRLRPWRAERASFGRRLVGLARSVRCVVVADVRECYGSIRPAVVEASLLGVGVARGPAVEVASFLTRVAGLGIAGLPVGPEASAVLANAVLSGLDGDLRRASVRHLRWVDDVVAGCDDVAHAKHVLSVIERALSRVGLELNESKTRIVLDPTTIGGARTVSDARSAPVLG